MFQKNRYVIQEGPDGTFWIPLQPLLADITEHADNSTDADANTRLAIESVRIFVQALISEGNYSKYVRENADETPYKETLQ